MKILLMLLLLICMESGLYSAQKLSNLMERVSIGGDLRLRHQWEDTGSNNRSRERIRLRLNTDVEVSDKTNVGFSLASGSADPRSTNQTLENSFSSKSIGLNYAYLGHFFSEKSGIYLGKYPYNKMIWVVSDLLWDTDITVEGVSYTYKSKKANSKFSLNTGAAILDERSSGKDPFIYVIQPVFEKNSSNGDCGVSFAYYGMSNVKDEARLIYSSGSNTLKENTALYKYDYNSVSMSFKAGKSGMFPKYAMFFADYVNAFGPSSDNTGMLAGIQYGDKKADGNGKWNTSVMYRKLQKDSWLDILPDADSVSGMTGYEGYEAIINYGLTESISASLDYYNAGIINSDKRGILQIDLVAKF